MFGKAVQEDAAQETEALLPACTVEDKLISGTYDMTYCNGNISVCVHFKATKPGYYNRYHHRN